MGKYNVGDKVIIRSDLETHKIYDQVYLPREAKSLFGQTVTISCVKCNGCYEIQESTLVINDDVIKCKADDERSVINMVRFEKKDLKVGHVIKCSNGQKYLVCNYSNGLFAAREYSYFGLASHREDLTYDSKELNIDYVYEVDYMNKLNRIFDDSNLRLIWSREDYDKRICEAKKIVAEMLNVDVDKVKITI